jgi:hypothetical protein
LKQPGKIMATNDTLRHHIVHRANELIRSEAYNGFSQLVRIKPTIDHHYLLVGYHHDQDESSKPGCCCKESLLLQ